MTYLTTRSDPKEVWAVFSEVSGYLAFDVGANGGMVANLLAERFDRVIAFEPCAESYAQLEQAVAANVRCEPVALSAEAGPVTLLETVHASRWGELVTGESLPDSWGPTTGERTVTAATLDQMAATYGLPDFVKIDTEGHEALIVQGGQHTLPDVPDILIEVHAVENGDRIRELLPAREWVETRHPGYAYGDHNWTNHYWIRSRL